MIKFVDFEEISDEKLFDEIKLLAVSVFGKIDAAKFKKRIFEKPDLLVNLAFDDEKIAGFKIGYRLDPAKFYSWLGGVDENYRSQNIACELMRRQHDWCIGKNYKIVQTKTKNSFKPMLILNIKSGFDIVDVYRDSRNELKIILEKDLTKS